MEEINVLKEGIRALEKIAKTKEEKKHIDNLKKLLNKLSKKPTYREEANAIVHQSLRAGFIEKLHTGENSKLLENPKYSRITQEEMKKLMIETSAKVAEFLEMKDKNLKRYENEINKITLFFTHDWDKKSKEYKMKK